MGLAAQSNPGRVGGVVDAGCSAVARVEAEVGRQEDAVLVGRPGGTPLGIEEPAHECTDLGSISDGHGHDAAAQGGWLRCSGSEGWQCDEPTVLTDDRAPGQFVGEEAALVVQPASWRLGDEGVDGGPAVRGDDGAGSTLDEAAPEGDVAEVPHRFANHGTGERDLVGCPAVVVVDAA